MAELGLITILMALALAVYSMLASIIGGMRNLPALSQSGRNACYLVALILLISSFSLVAAFLSNNFQIRYVFEHSNLAMPRIYTWVAIYAGNEGSLLFIATVFSILAALAVAFSPRRFRPSLPYANAVLMLIMVFFLSVMASLANPFVTLDFMPADGRGINPLLVHPGMFAHPPILMTGLVMVSIPFAFAVGALLSKQVADQWVDVARVWGLLAWATLGAGLLLGSWWAYTILGWGGYWAWDPVENAGLMPWLGLTAFIHSIMVQKRQGMFRMWNLALINITFGLSLFGMFINRGGPVPSVHSFAASSLGWVFLTFMIVGTLAPFALFFIRYNLIKSARPLESSLSREAAFLVNNLLLLGVAFVTLWGVVYPLVSEVFSGFTVTVGEPFYNQVNGHIFLGLMFLMGVGPLLPWRRAGGRAFKRTLLYPALAAVATLVVLALVGVRNPYALAAFTLFALVAAGIFQEWYRGTRVRHTRGEAYPLAFLKLMASNRPRYGGYVVHLAIVVLGVGIVGSSFYGTQRDVLLSPGQTVTVEGYDITYLDSRTVQQTDRRESFYTLDVSRGDKYVGELEAERTFYPDFNISATRAGIRSTPVEDLYVVPSEAREGDPSIGFRIFVNPLVWWMWLAGPIMIAGTAVALWPSRSSAPPPTPPARSSAFQSKAPRQ